MLSPMTTSQIALFAHPLHSLQSMSDHSEPSLFLSESEINSFLQLDLDEDSMNESIGIDTQNC